MNNGMYDKILQTYQLRQRKRLIISLALVVIGALTAASVVGAVVCIVALVYFILEGIRTLSTNAARNKCVAQLKSEGRFDLTLQSLSGGMTQEMDGLTYVWSEDYFMTGYGMILNMKEIAWIFPYTHTVTYFMIPVMRYRYCKAMMLDGTERIIFNGQARNKAAFESLLSGMLSKNPELLIGHTPANQELYRQRVEQHTKSQNT